MASCTTPTFGNASTCPRVTLEVNISSNTATTVTLSWVLKYYARSAAQTSVSKKYTAVIAGATVASGSYSINGKTGTHTIASGTKAITKGTSAQTISFSCSMGFNLTWSGTYGGTKSASGSISVAAKDKYTISYNANGGSGAPGSQTKWAGTNIKLSSSKPTRTGYTFAGWATSSSGSVAYQPGATYSANASVTLYAKWNAITYTVTYNANGGSGAPGNQTKTYGVNLTLSSTRPTRTNYTFKGWGTSTGTTTVSYVAGGTYSSNASITLYAIWDLAYTAPRITGFSVDRCNSDGTASESGTYAKVIFSWETDKAVSSIKIDYKQETASTWTSVSIYASGTSNSVNTVIGGSLSIDYSYNIRVTVTDSLGSSDATRTVGGMVYTMDLLSGGNGIAFGKPATKQGVMDIGFKTRFTGGIDHIPILSGTDLNSITTPGYYTCGANATAETLMNCPTNYAFVMEVLSHAGLYQRLTIYKDSDVHTYVRNYYSYTNVWGPWQIMINTELIEGDTDLNTVLIPGIYYSRGDNPNKPSIIYTNSFTLEVVPAGADGQIMQRITRCDKDIPAVCIRYRYQDAFGPWQVVSYPGLRVLWSGGYYMTASHTATLNESIANQEHGIVLVFSAYSGGVKNEQWAMFFIPKKWVYDHNGTGVSFNLCSHYGNTMKYLYIHYEKIVGNNLNGNSNHTVGGITYDNSRCVLRYVIGV